jgi:hypothetical protein
MIVGVEVLRTDNSLLEITPGLRPLDVGRCRGGAAIVLAWEPGRRGHPDSPTIAGRS